MLKLIKPVAACCAAVALAAASPALAQSSGASPADPNNERNQTMAPSNTQPSDPAANRNPGARVPTAPVDKQEAENEEGGATGTRGTNPATAEDAPPPAPDAIPPG